MPRKKGSAGADGPRYPTIAEMLGAGELLTVETAVAAIHRRERRTLVRRDGLLEIGAGRYRLYGPAPVAAGDTPDELLTIYQPTAVAVLTWAVGEDAAIAGILEIPTSLGEYALGPYWFIGPAYEIAPEKGAEWTEQRSTE